MFWTFAVYFVDLIQELIKIVIIIIDSTGFIDTFLMDLSKAYDCFLHNLIIAKFEAYGSKRNSLKLLLDHLKPQEQRVKIGSLYSFWPDLKRGKTQDLS